VWGWRELAQKLMWRFRKSRICVGVEKTHAEDNVEVQRSAHCQGSREWREEKMVDRRQYGCMVVEEVNNGVRDPIGTKER
jgi:hypothetical protein